MDYEYGYTTLHVEAASDKRYLLAYYALFA